MKDNDIFADAIGHEVRLVQGHNPLSAEKSIELSRLVEYYQLGEKVGERSWHTNGKLGFEKLYKNGVLDGPMSVWDREARLRDKYLYLKGQRYGTENHWHSNGTLSETIPFKQDHVHGIVRLWSDGGKRIHDLQESYINGRRLDLYNVDGNPVTRAEYILLQLKDSTLPKLLDED